MPSHLSLSILREASSNILTMFLADGEAMPVCPKRWRHFAIHDTHAQTVERRAGSDDVPVIIVTSSPRGNRDTGPRLLRSTLESEVVSGTTRDQ